MLGEPIHHPIVYIERIVCTRGISSSNQQVEAERLHAAHAKDRGEQRLPGVKRRGAHYLIPREMSCSPFSPAVLQSLSNAQLDLQLGET